MSKREKPTLTLAVMGGQVRKRIINLETLQGLDSTVECYGFDEKGVPVEDGNGPNLKFRLAGEFRGGVNLSYTFYKGVRIFGRNEKGENVEKERLAGWDAVAVMLSRAGCAVDAETVKLAVEKLIADGTTRIYCYRLAWASGLAEGYGSFEDRWCFGGGPTNPTGTRSTAC